MGGDAFVTAKRKVLVVGSASLFGSAVEGLLGTEGGERLEVESVGTVEAAIEAAPRFRPDVIVFCLERDDTRDEHALHRLRLMDVYPARIVRCTLEHNHLTVYDTKRITDATPEDLVAAVCRIGEDSLDYQKRGDV
jgi:DNA-binding NarL/FixJ family response regulator